MGGLTGLNGLLIWINVINLTALMFLFQLPSESRLCTVQPRLAPAQLLPPLWENTDVGGVFPILTSELCS